MVMTIGQRIKHVRLIQGLTQAQLAARLGVSRSLVAMLETDLALPPDELVERLNETLGVDLNSEATETALVHLQGAVR